MPRPTRSTARRSSHRPLGDARAQASVHRATRRAHESELAEDYVEIIAELRAVRGAARTVDIARRLGVTHVTVVRTLARLRRAGLVDPRPDRAILLTPRGAALASAARRRHDTVVNFLLAIGVRSPAALADAEGIEHHVSGETLAAFERLLRSRRSRRSVARRA